MSTWMFRSAAIALVLALAVGPSWEASGQQAPPEQPAPSPGLVSDQPPPVPRGIEVMARGPVHEAFATPTTEPRATPVVPKRPPPALDEMPPEERPEGDVVWIAGYWSWDDDRNDFLWVSGCWRSKPPGKEWVTGYWREEGPGAQWVPGFWHAAANDGQTKAVTYYPEPPAPPQVAPPAPQPAPDTFYTPGYYVWNGDRYAWRAGYWARVQPGYVWVPAHYRWTPYGHIYVAGYWDLAVARRGMLYAPVVVDPQVVTVGYVYTPAYAVSDTVVLDTLFVRPCWGCYYFGDYYGPRYVGLGYESGFVYGRRHYDSIVVYACWEHRAEPRWLDARVNICFARDAGRAWVPPRTLAAQNVFMREHRGGVAVMLAPAARIAAARGQRVVRVDERTRLAAREQARQVQRVAIAQRRLAERPGAAGARPTAPRTAALSVPAARAVSPQGGLATRVTSTTTSVTRGAATPNGTVRTTTTTTTKTTTATTRPGLPPHARPGTPLPHRPVPNNNHQNPPPAHSDNQNRRPSDSHGGN